MLQLNHIKKSYDKKEVLSDVNYTFEEGHIYPLLGAAGAGRTTLFECICEDLTIDEGNIVTKEKQNIFFAAKQSILPMFISGKKFVHVAANLKNDKTNVQEYLLRVGLSRDKWDKWICDYSFEDKKRLQLAAFLSQKPYIIMFDEPLDYCDENYIETFLKILEEEKKDHIIIISTSLLSMARRIAKDILVLNSGEIYEIPENMIDVPEIANALSDILGEIEG